MVRKFTRPPRAPAPESIVNPTPTTTMSTDNSSTNSEQTLSVPTKRRSTPQSLPKPSTSTSKGNYFFDEPLTSKRMRLPHRPYQAPEPIPMKILQLIKSDDENNLLNRQNQESKMNKPQKRVAPDNPITPKRKKSDVFPKVQNKKILIKKEAISVNKNQKPVLSSVVATISKNKTNIEAKYLVKKAKVSIKGPFKSKLVTPTPTLTNKKLTVNGIGALTTKSVKPKIKKIKNKEQKTKKDSEQPVSAPIPPMKLDFSLKRKKNKISNLIARENVTKYDKDPTFDSAIPIPNISTVAQSKLLIRATRTGNNKLLEKLVKEKKDISSFCTPQSLHINRDAAYYAVERENIDALKLLLNSKLAENLGPFPDSSIEEESTGKGSYMMLGHGLRAVTVARGGKEGNNALTKDTSNQEHAPACSDQNSLMKYCMELGKPISTISKIIALSKDNENSSWNQLLYQMNIAFLRGHNKLAGELVAEAIKRGGFGFNELHKEALILSNKKPFSPFKSVSVVKKATGNARVTPIHLAAINPDQQYLATLLNSKPDFNILDTSHRTPIHYAAVCSGTGPLSFLLSRGISVEVLDKEGKSPLYLAAETGRTANVEKIIKSLLGSDSGETDTESAPVDISGPYIDRLCKSTGLSPIHIAAENGHDEVVQILLDLGANAEKTTPAQHDKLTALMIAAQFGHLAVVKILIEKGQVKVDAKDKRGRTALTHAVIDGNAHIVSYLLRLGADNKVKDSSGNTLVHYAVAYGWLFNWKLLLESGCPANEQNDWKMTPVAIAFMKGHIGLVELALSHTKGSDSTDSSGVDINSPVNYSNGMTLLHQTCSGKPGELLVPRIKFLIESQGGDVGVLDYEKNNALHYLARAEGRELLKRPKRMNWMSDEAIEELEKENKKIHESIFAAAKLLLRHNCDPQKLNLRNETAVTLAGQLGCFELLKIFLNSGNCEKLCPVEATADDNSNSVTTILHNIVENIRDITAVNFYKFCLSHPKLITELKSMARKVNCQGYTPLLLFLSKLDELSSLQTNESESSAQSRILDFLKFLVNTLDSDLNQPVKDKTKNFALHIIAQATQPCIYIDKVVDILLLKKPTLDSLNGESRTPLLLAVSSLNESVSRALLNAGASPNFQSTKDDGKSILIMAAETATASFNLIPLLVDKGANVRDLSPKTGNSVLHLVASQPGNSSSIEVIRRIIATGKIDVIGVNKLGRTALHLAVNARGGETDVSYDVEDLLIEIGPKALTVADSRGRFPLHYALVKIGRYRDSSFIDPIELVAILTRAMKDSNVGDKIHTPDEFLMTPLHYAAQRGATISSSLLISEARGEKSKINPVDGNGNTPYGLAVLKGHEGCALYFQQSGGDFMNSLNSRFKPEITNPLKPWKWRHSILVDEYDEKKLQERSKYSILQEVVRKDWQGLLHLMLEKLKNSGAGVTPAIEVAIKTNRLKLAVKLINRVKNNRELSMTREQQSLLHTMAKSNESLDIEFSRQLVQSLVLKGIGINFLDPFKATPLTYAAQNLNYNLCQEFWKYTNITDIVKQPADKLGRTPFSALFWNITSDSTLPLPLKAWAEQLLIAGAEANILCQYPITLSPYPVTRSLVTQESAYSCKLSPLIIAVIQGNYAVVKWLLGLNKSGRTFVDSNYPDELGRTALIHAARLNDVKMVKLLLNSRTYDPEKDKKPWNSKGKVNKVNNPDTSIDLKTQDRNGWTVIHHLVAPLHPSNIFYFNSDVILRLLAAVGAPLESKSLNKQTPLNLARHLKVYKLATVLQTLLGIHDYSTTTNDEQDNSSATDGETKVMTGQIDKVDFTKDAAKMAEKLVAEYKEKNPSESEESLCEPDSLSGMNKENSEVVFDESHNTPYDCLLTQVDLSYGMYGLYNFYKMQVIKEKYGKELIILFTRWGRVGDTGQFQKTPFPTAEEAIKEFCKIFRSKSGNSWENVKTFSPVPKKYRLVNKEYTRLKGTKKNIVKVDFVELEKMALCTGSNIPSGIFELIKILCLIHRSRLTHAHDDDDIDNPQLPHESLNSETLEQGDKILDEISKLIVSKELVRKKSNYDDSQYSDFMNSLIEKSEEFYALIPVYGFEFEKLSPMFSWDLLRPKQEKIHSLVHLGFATQLLLASQLYLKEENPFDYIYKSLGTKIELIDQSSEDAQLILQYIENTSEHSRRHNDSPTIQGIYKVQRPGEAEQMKNIGIGNKWLLWHGTRTANILSILHKGLQAVPLGSELSGQMFGKGIYFADTFSKSRNYCSHESGGDYPQNFIFLCEVALGNVQNVDFNDITAEQSALKSSFDSLKTCNAKMIPDPGSVIYWKGGIVPLGVRIENIPEKEDEYFSLEHNEYIIFNTNQVRLRYLVQF